MPQAHRAVALLGVGLVSAAVGLAPAATAATSPTYVAIGDSYAAGFGLPLPAVATGQPTLGCQQTTLDYPRRLAATLGFSLTDATCSGAVTDDFTSSQDVDGPDPAPQLDAVRAAQPDLVTITIGGNDLGFTSIAGDCLAASANGPILSQLAKGRTVASCRDYYASPAGQASDPYARIAPVAAKVRAAIAATQAAAPRAKIAVIGYPAIAPDAAHTPAGGCFNANLLPVPVTVSGVPLASALPFTDVDIPYLQVLQQRLNDAVAQQAQQLGVAYADVYPDSLAHSACSPESTRWVEPLLPGGGGTNVLHPSLAGTRAMADTLTPVVRTLLAGAAPTSTTAPTVTSSAGAGAPTTAAPTTTVPTSTTAVGATTVPTTTVASPGNQAASAPSDPSRASAPVVSAQARTTLASTGMQGLVQVLVVAGVLVAGGAALVLAGRHRR